ncbi:hypothetical protein P171DRAFT_256938 [Karstenula rhodostoma CBS 690.94]|uniref:Uncharacterized protein n=1 Tax=Karstenula rhodostoma CBS 690.94 TaxID=1392251 RepID=A0A9P4PP17_9PLEO|nr:hypothetical protein P171DRAFT_256938 [Karstenula rhodostoma CBS 690.94]
MSGYSVPYERVHRSAILLSESSFGIRLRASNGPTPRSAGEGRDQYHNTMSSYGSDAMWQRRYRTIRASAAICQSTDRGTERGISNIWSPVPKGKLHSRKHNSTSDDDKDAIRREYSGRCEQAQGLSDRYSTRRSSYWGVRVYQAHAVPQCRHNDQVYSTHGRSGRRTYLGEDSRASGCCNLLAIPVLHAVREIGRLRREGATP